MRCQMEKVVRQIVPSYFLRLGSFFRRNQIDKKVVPSLDTIKRPFLSFVPSLLFQYIHMLTVYDHLTRFYNYFIFPAQKWKDLNWFLCLQWFPCGCALHLVIIKSSLFLGTDHVPWSYSLHTLPESKNRVEDFAWSLWRFTLVSKLLQLGPSSWKAGIKYHVCLPDHSKIEEFS